jgi:hypothetical protein
VPPVEKLFGKNAFMIAQWAPIWNNELRQFSFVASEEGKKKYPRGTSFLSFIQPLILIIPEMLQ